MEDKSTKQARTEYMKKWRAENKQHYKEYQREYKRRYRAKKALEAKKNG